MNQTRHMYCLLSNTASKLGLRLWRHRRTCVHLLVLEYRYSENLVLKPFQMFKCSVLLSPQREWVRAVEMKTLTEREQVHLWSSRLLSVSPPTSPCGYGCSREWACVPQCQCVSSCGSERGRAVYPFSTACRSWRSLPLNRWGVCFMSP